jgi:hypothetical protein
MSTVPHVLAIQEAVRGLDRLLENLTFQIDTRQWALAGYTLGMLYERGHMLSVVASTARQSLSDAECVDRQPDTPEPPAT